MTLVFIIYSGLFRNDSRNIVTEDLWHPHSLCEIRAIKFLISGLHNYSLCFELWIVIDHEKSNSGPNPQISAYVPVYSANWTSQRYPASADQSHSGSAREMHTSPGISFKEIILSEKWHITSKTDHHISMTMHFLFVTMCFKLA